MLLMTHMRASVETLNRDNDNCTRWMIKQCRKCSCACTPMPCCAAVLTSACFHCRSGLQRSSHYSPCGIFRFSRDQCCPAIHISLRVMGRHGSLCDTHSHTHTPRHTLDKNWIIEVTRWELNPNNEQPNKSVDPR